MKTTHVFLITLFSIVLCFQGCGKDLGFISGESTITRSKGNGDGYTGKPDPYDLRIPNQLCSEQGANGQPLPNAQVFIFPGIGAELVRESCADITPRPLSPDEYTINASGQLIYQGQVYLPNFNQTPFAVVAASCPVGKTPLANPVRSSLIGAPLDLQSPAWGHAGLTVKLEGSLASLPVYKVERADATMLQGYRRMAQTTSLLATETYVFSFFTKTTSSERALFTSFFPNNHDFRIEFDLQTGAPLIQSTSGVNLISTNAQALSGGVFITIYFKLLNDGPANIGVASLGTTLGSSISTSAIQLEQVSNFCSP